MDWDAIDWRALERLRAGFLEGNGGQRDYWQSRADMVAYDETFAQRIAWKWDFVLADLKAQGWSPPPGEVLDWGCGSGIAARRFLSHFGVECVSTLTLHDRSTQAMEFAAAKTREEFPALTVKTRRDVTPAAPVSVLLISHVLSELSESQLSQLEALAQGAACVLWVEPGTHQTSRALIAVRERLHGNFHIVAPCTHQETCGMLTETNARHWCHQFATAPQQVYTDGNWVKFGHRMGIDLRALPLSYLVLDKRSAGPSLPPGCTRARIIGRPRVYKAYSMLFACDASGARDRRLMKRHLADEFRATKKDQFGTLQTWTLDGNDVVDVKK